MSFFSTLYMLQNVLIVNISCKHCITIQKKKKKEEDPYFGMGKNVKSYTTNTPLSIFSLGKGRESLHLKHYKSYKFSSVFSDLSPPVCTKLDKGINDAPQICPKYINYVCFFTRILHLSSNRRE